MSKEHTKDRKALHKRVSQPLIKKEIASHQNLKSWALSAGDIAQWTKDLLGHEFRSSHTHFLKTDVMADVYIHSSAEVDTEGWRK